MDKKILEMLSHMRNMFFYEVPLTIRPTRNAGGVIIDGFYNVPYRVMLYLQETNKRFMISRSRKNDKLLMIEALNEGERAPWAKTQISSSGKECLNNEIVKVTTYTAGDKICSDGIEELLIKHRYHKKFNDIIVQVGSIGKDKDGGDVTSIIVQVSTPEKTDNVNGYKGSNRWKVHSMEKTNMNRKIAGMYVQRIAGKKKKRSTKPKYYKKRN